MATVLVVDDSPVDRRLVGGLLEKADNLSVRYAVDGDDAMTQIQQDPPDLVLTDLIMPGKSGLELVSQVVNESSLIPVILMTGKGSEEIAVDALKAGASSYVPKNALAQLLVDTVENVLNVSQEERTQLKLMDCMTSNQCSFELDNDDSMIPPLISYLHRCVRAVGLCDETGGVRLCVALEESLRNALHHGNLELDSSLREDDGKKYQELFQQRRSEAPYNERKILVKVDIDNESGTFIIRDQGPGFNPNDLPDPTDPANLEKATGRGLLLMRTFMDEVSFNDSGNEVTMIKRVS